jgi:hypothetical protein
MMRRARKPESIDAWRSYHCETKWSISLCDEDGSEIKCLGGADDADEAFAAAVDLMETHYLDLPVRLLSDSGEIVREYESEEE